MVNEIIDITRVAVPTIVGVAAVGGILSGYVKAPTNKAYIITGLRKQPKILIGRAGIKIPFLERKDELALQQISIDIKTNGVVPTLDYIGVEIDAVAKIQIDTSEKGMALAVKNFLNMSEKEIISSLTDSLQGNMREIIGSMTLKEISNDRKKFGDQIQEKAQNDMNALGIKIISCNVQEVTDEQGLINDLGQDNLSQIKKQAQIAKAEADRDVAVAKAEATQSSNEAQVKAELEIEKRNTELSMQKAELKRQADIKKAEADAAYQIQQEEQRKIIEAKTADANIIRQEKEIELKEREVAIQEKMLEATVKKQAEAERFAAEQKAEADLYRVQKKSESEKFERERKSEADKFEAEMEAEAVKAESEAKKIAMENEAAGIRAKGEAEAAAIAAKGKAEADALLAKAEAMKQYGDAARQQMELDTLKVLFEQYPKIAEAVGNGYSNVDSIKMFGGETSQLAGNIMKTVEQVTDGIGESLGLDVKSLISGFLGGKIATKENPVNVTIENAGE